MAKSSVRRDPFARGEYERMSHGPGICGWCGRQARVLFTYVWRNDDNNHSLDAAHRRARTFCGFDCFESYHS